MNELYDKRAGLTRKLTEITAYRALLLERYGPILTDRTRRVEIERLLRSHEKPMLALLAVTGKLALVKEDLALQPASPSEATNDREFRVREAQAFHRKSLLEEEQRLVRRIAEGKGVAEQVEELRAELTNLRPEDPLLADMVENVQQDFNIAQEELRQTEAEIAADKGGPS